MNRQSARLKYLLCILCLGPWCLCKAGSVRLFSGESANGKVTLGGNGITVAPEHAPSTSYELANVFAANFTDRPTSEIALLPAGAVLTNGAFVPGSVRSLDEPTVKLGPASHPVSIPTTSIAAIVFSPTPRTTIYRIPNGKTGAILPGGDFFEGTFTGFQRNTVTVNSLLFGPHPFTISSQISAVLLRDIQIAPARFEITTKDGSRFFTNDANANLNRDGISFTDLVSGPTKVAAGDLVEIRAGRGRFQALGESKPVSAVTASGADASSSVATSDDAENGSALFTRANVAVTYAIPAGLNGFSCATTVPADAPQAARVTFAVYCDGRLIMRTIQIAPGGAPQPIRVNCGTAQRITLRVEPAAPGSDAVTGKWLEPMFLRP